MNRRQLFSGLFAAAAVAVLKPLKALAKEPEQELVQTKWYYPYYEWTPCEPIKWEDKYINKPMDDKVETIGHGTSIEFGHGKIYIRDIHADVIIPPNKVYINPWYELGEMKDMTLEISRDKLKKMYPMYKKGKP